MYTQVWDDVEPVFDAVSVESIKLAVETGDPGAVLWKLAHATGGPAKKWTIAMLRPILEPELKKDGLQWGKWCDFRPRRGSGISASNPRPRVHADDAVPIFDAISVADLKLAVETENPDQILWKLAEATGAFAKKWAIQKLRPLIEPELAKESLVWDDLVPFIDAICMKDIQSALKSTPCIHAEWHHFPAK